MTVPSSTGGPTIATGGAAGIVVFFILERFMPSGDAKTLCQSLTPAITAVWYWGWPRVEALLNQRALKKRKSRARNKAQEDLAAAKIAIGNLPRGSKARQNLTKKIEEQESRLWGETTEAAVAEALNSE